MKQSTLEWINKAESDYHAAVSLGRRRKIFFGDQTCFHCQQSAEKYIKARLEEANVRIPKTHDLVVLLHLAIPFEPLWAALLVSGKRLSDYAVKIRYPGTEATAQEMKTALQDVLPRQGRDASMER